MFSVILKGGILLLPIIVCSVVLVAIVLERLYRFRTVRLTNGRLVRSVLDAIERGQVERALSISREAAGPVPRIMAAGLKAFTKHKREVYIEKAIVRTGSLELAFLERNLRGLDVIANIAPLLGLLGTVTGMIRAFMQIQAHGSGVNAALLAGGIWEAMLTTAAGLTVAIPALLFYNYFQGRLNRLEAAMQDTAGDLIEAIRGDTDHAV